MELRISFKPGMKQSFTAARYFNGTAEEALQDSIARLTPRQYLISLPNDDKLRLRIWSKEEYDEERTQHAVAWLQGLHEDVDAIVRSERRDERLGEIISLWIASENEQESFFIEELKGPPGEQPEDDPRLTLGVLGGQLVLLSTESIMFARLQPGVFGLSLARYGSYLIEQERPVPRLMKRA
ncbi:MAG: hypothetical protein H6591_13480 [Flavobacteriales bacterium]|nr:hypothetical protein [Flavobacteriales bacterium]